MILIGLFFPAMIAMAIRRKRNNEAKNDWFSGILEYGQTVLFCNLFTMIIITYVLKIDGVEITAFNSFSFFTKYVIIAIVYSALIPYLEEIIQKYFQVKFTVEKKK